AHLLRYGALFPHSLIGAGGSFALAPVDGGTEVTVEARMAAAPPIETLLRAVFPFAAFQRHLAEEGARLAELVR
ncbi:MAG TPA: hypothetical protein VFX49_19745, partial [Chloroflexota bacterium]|nr:hypothetical protein [Chloroflexota bacterium]